MSSWYYFSIIALICFGLQRFLYKVSAEWKCDTAITTITFMITVSLLGFIFFFLSPERFEHFVYLFITSCINGTAFVISTVSIIEALKYLSGNVVYPLTRLGTVIVVIFSILYFRDEPSFSQYAGLMIGISVIIVYSWYNDDATTDTGTSRRGIVLAIIALISGAIAAISSKFAAVHVGTYAFITLSYLMGLLLAYPLGKIIKKERGGDDFKRSLLIGIIIGMVNFSGFLFLMKALSKGPLSLIVSVTGMHFVIAIVLSALIFNERVTMRKAAAIAMTVVSVILMRF